MKLNSPPPVTAPPRLVAEERLRGVLEASRRSDGELVEPADELPMSAAGGAS